MDSSSVVWENKERIYGEKLKKSLLALLIKTPLLIGSISSQISGENSFKEVGKTGTKTHLKSCSKQSIRAPFYKLGKTSRWDKTVVQTAVGRPARSTVAWKQRAELFAGRPTRSTRAFQRAELSGWSTDPVDRPSSQSWRAHLCTSVDRLLARSTGRSQKQGL